MELRNPEELYFFYSELYIPASKVLRNRWGMILEYLSTAFLFAHHHIPNPFLKSGNCILPSFTESSKLFSISKVL
jgi:hypothetical protein